MKEECAFCNGSKVELVDGLGVPCVWCDPVGTAIAEDKLEREGDTAAPAAAPVPPAGDVEVQRWEPENTIVGYNMKPVFDGSFVLHDHYSRDVTRLTAERDGLENALDACDGDRHRLLDKNTYLQSELTKARELLAERSALHQLAIRLLNQSSSSLNPAGKLAKEIRKVMDTDHKLKLLAAPIAHNVDESCGQDAEAAKCASCEASTVEICDEKGCGFLGAGNGAPAAKYDCCANCMRPESEHSDNRCPQPYTTVWNAWDYDFAPDAKGGA